MFTYNAQDLNNEDRNRQETDAHRQQLANEVRNNQGLFNVKFVNRKAVVSAVITLIFATVFFVSGGNAAAQDSTSLNSAGGGEGGAGGLEVLYLAVGLDALRTGDFDEALRGFNDSLATNPEYAAAYAARAMLYIIQGDLDTALADALAGYNINPESPEINFVLGAVYYEMGQFDNSRSHYQAYVAIVAATESEPPMMAMMFDGNSIALAEAQIASSNEYLLAVGG